MSRNARDDYSNGQAYEAFVCEHRWLTPASPWDDQHLGDTKCGTEIKFDQRLHQTNNVFFEIKQLPMLHDGRRAGSWKLCGCFNGCRKYFIGDCSRALLFDSDELRKFLKAEVFNRIAPKIGTTFKGYALPFDGVSHVALQIVRWPYHWDHCLTNYAI